MSPLRLLGVVMVAVIAGTGGVPLSCPPDMICLKDYKKEKFHRLNIDCRDLTAILDENGDFFGRNVLYNNISRCITWRDGILSDCAVTETDYDGWKTKLPITYNCTEAAADPTPGDLTTPSSVFHSSKSENPTPGDLTRTQSSRHHWFFAAAVAAFAACVVSVFLWIFYGKCLQEQFAPQKVLVPSSP